MLVSCRTLSYAYSTSALCCRSQKYSYQEGIFFICLAKIFDLIAFQSPTNYVETLSARDSSPKMVVWPFEILGTSWEERGCSDFIRITG